MAEVAGTALGGPGPSWSPFLGQAVQCVDVLRLARVQDYDLMILRQQLEDQRARFFFIWGESVGLH